MRRPAVPPPDAKDWTWTLERPCADCGFESAAVAPGDIGSAVRQATLPWQEVLLRPAADERPAPTVWSPLEYGAHVRDVCLVFTGRVDRLLTADDPVFPNWDQDRAALDGRYWELTPRVVATEIAAAAEPLARAYAGVSEAGWARTGVRSNGARFTTLTLGRYLLHDLCHHLWDVRA